jgi:ABC-type multidrug transport system ATPase subunit
MSITFKTLIGCSNLSKKYGQFFALKNISFQIKENIILGIVGENGAGKTTLIKCLSGLLRPTYGGIKINDSTFKDKPLKIKSQIGILTDDSFLYEKFSIYENLEFYSKLHFNFTKTNIKKQIEKLAEIFEISDWLHEPIQNLSKGMKKKVELIRVLIHQPQILFLDEPFSSLDQKIKIKFINLLKELKKKENLTIVLSTHDTEIAKQFCDEILIIKKGQLVKTIEKNEFREIKIIDYM